MKIFLILIKKTKVKKRKEKTNGEHKQQNTGLRINNR